MDSTTSENTIDVGLINAIIEELKAAVGNITAENAVLKTQLRRALLQIETLSKSNNEGVVNT